MQTEIDILISVKIVGDQGPQNQGGGQWGHVPPHFFKIEKSALFSGLKCPIYRTKKVFLE
jgi:hypothetical protein